MGKFTCLFNQKLQQMSHHILPAPVAAHAWTNHYILECNVQVGLGLGLVLHSRVTRLSIEEMVLQEKSGFSY